MGIEARRAASERHQSVSISIVAWLQSTFDFPEHGHDAHILADGVSSCKKEVPLALERMRQAGAQITTSEGMLFQLQGAYFQARDLQSACVILRMSVTQSMHRVRTSREGRGGDHNADALAC